MAINMAGQIHQVDIQKGALTVERLLETAAALERYLEVGEMPTRHGNVATFGPQAVKPAS